MAVQSFLARCLRASSSSSSSSATTMTANTFLRPMPQSLPILRNGQLFQTSQRFGYASSSNSPSSKPDGANDASKPNTLSSESSESESSSPAQEEDLMVSTVKLRRSLLNLRSGVSSLSRRVHRPNPTRVFVPYWENQGQKAQQTAEEQLDSLLKRTDAVTSTQTSESSSSTITMPLETSSSSSPAPPRLRPVPMKLGTKLGRQVLVSNERGVDCASAIRQVQINCSVNGIRRQANLQKFHIRRGQRRKDLKSERWRKLFKFSFDETVKKIQRMRAQGW